MTTVLIRSPYVCFHTFAVDLTDSWVRFSIRFDILDRTHDAFCAIVFIWSDDFSAFLTHKLVYEFFVSHVTC